MRSTSVFLDGIVASGLGEGAYFMSMPHYKKEIRKKLSFEAYPGTLNLKIAKKQKEMIKGLGKIEVAAFKKGGKAFGGVDCYMAKINGIAGAVIIPHLTKHREIIEFIAPVHLKSELSMKDGDKIKIEMLKWQE